MTHPQEHHMTNSVTFDTSGEVFIPDRRFPVGATRIRFSDLSPFCQGYVEAAFASLLADASELFDAPPSRDGWAEATSRPLGFSDLHPATLARFMEDCERWLDRYPKTERTHEKGANAWRYRQEQLVERPEFPKLRLYLDDSGKVQCEDAR
jgi:hypothetical protein